MKRIYVILMVLTFILAAGCTKVTQGNYKEGAYLGSVETASRGARYVTTAFVYVNDNGFIKSVFIDSTYTDESNHVNTTKKVLGAAYGMKETSANLGVIKGGAEWYEQVKVIEDKVVAEQDINWVKWSDEAKTKLNTDTISGVTITANDYITAISKALDQAKK